MTRALMKIMNYHGKNISELVTLLPSWIKSPAGRVLPVTAVPPSSEGFYAINNQFLQNGPKGFLECKVLENGDSYIRFDLPGVPKEGFKAFLDETKKFVWVMAIAPKEHEHDISDRIIDGVKMSPKLHVNGEKIPCTCHQFSGLTSTMSDGVLRLIINKIQTTTHQPHCSSLLAHNPELGVGVGRVLAILTHLVTWLRRGTGHKFGNSDPHDPNLTGMTLMPHPSITQGSQMAYESKVLQNGGLYVRVDMPGVPKDNFTVSVTNGRVRVTGEAPALSHDSSGRFYSGDVAIVSGPDPVGTIQSIAKNGVLRLIITLV